MRAGLRCRVTLREFYPVEEGTTIRCSACGLVICEAVEEAAWVRSGKSMVAR